MKKHFIIFEDDINNKTVTDLANRIQSYDNVHLYFSTFGGYTTDMMFLIKIMNSHPKIKITLDSYLVSAGALLLTHYTGKIEVAKTFDYFLFHKEDRKLYQLRKQEVEAKQLIKCSEKRNKEEADKLLELGIFNEKQYKNYMKGKDVVIFKKDIKWGIKKL